MRAQRSTPVHAAGWVAHFLGSISKDDRITAGLALKRVAQDGSDPSTVRGDLQGASLLVLISSRPEYTHARVVFDLPLWRLLGPDAVPPDALVEMQDALNWELALGRSYGPAGAIADDPGTVRVRNGRVPPKAVAMVLGSLGSLRWRTLESRQFTDVIRLLASRPSWPGLTMLCVLLLRMEDSEAQRDLSVLRQAIVTCIESLSARPHVDPRTAAIFKHLVRRRILSAMRSLDHAAPVREWAREQLADLERACVTDRDRRWHSRQLDALACAAGAVPGPGSDWLGCLLADAIDKDPAVNAVRCAIEGDVHAFRLHGASRRKPA